MLPMGTIMAASMLLGVISATDLPLIRTIKSLPKNLLTVIASLVLLAGLWNVLWYASRHLGEYWGNAALISGGLMILTSCYHLIPERLPVLLVKLKPIVLLALLTCSFLYGITISRM